jgi:hypothetical protein
MLTVYCQIKNKRQTRYSGAHLLFQLLRGQRNRRIMSLRTAQAKLGDPIPETKYKTKGLQTWLKR